MFIILKPMVFYGDFDILGDSETYDILRGF